MKSRDSKCPVYYMYSYYLVLVVRDKSDMYYICCVYVIAKIFVSWMHCSKWHSGTALYEHNTSFNHRVAVLVQLYLSNSFLLLHYPVQRYTLPQ